VLPKSKGLLQFLCCGLILIVVSSGCNRGEKPENQKPAVAAHERTIIAVGDSLTAGYGVAEDQAYPAKLEEKLRRNGYSYRVINAGVSGETSSGTLARIDWIAGKKPDIVLLETGANDALRGMPISLIRSNLEETINKLQAQKIEVVLAGMQMVRNLGPLYTAGFAKIYKEVARDRQVILIPFFLAGVAADPGLNQEDTIHPTAKGYTIVADTVYPFVVQAIEKRARRGP